METTIDLVDDHTLEHVLSLASAYAPRTTPEALATQLMAVNKRWRDTVRKLSLWKKVSWHTAAKSDLSSLLLALTNWLGRQLEVFEASSPIHSHTFDLLTDDVLVYIVRHSPSLRVLSLRNCARITDYGLVRAFGGASRTTTGRDKEQEEDAFSHPPITSLSPSPSPSPHHSLPLLTKFSLVWCGPGIYSKGLCAITESCPVLREFSISCGQESKSLQTCGDELAHHLVTKCPLLEHLELSDTKLTEEGLISIAVAYNSQLRSLKLNYTSDCWEFGSAQAVGERCKGLEVFSACSSNIDDESLYLITRGCRKSLRLLCVDRCKNLSLECIQRVVREGVNFGRGGGGGGGLECLQMSGIARRLVSRRDQAIRFCRWAEDNGFFWDDKQETLFRQY